MGSVIAFRPRLSPPEDDGTSATSAIAHREARGELIIFPGTDISSVLPALSPRRGKAKKPRQAD